MSLTKALVIKTMQDDISKVESETWMGLPDKVCSPSTERKLRIAHEDSSFQQAQRCREVYLETSRRRLSLYRNTGEIDSRA